MTILAIIPARGGSVGIPKKNLMDFCGRPLLEWSITHARQSNHVDEVWVSSDCEEILTCAKACGANGLERPVDLSTGTATSESALEHALMHWASNFGDIADIECIVFLQATSPLRNAEDIDKAIELFREQKADSLFSAAMLDDFCIWDGNEVDGFNSLSYDHKNRGMRDTRPPLTLENGSIYVFKPEILIGENNRIGGKISVFYMPYWKSYEIDEPSDIEIVEWYMRHKILSKETPKA